MFVLEISINLAFNTQVCKMLKPGKPIKNVLPSGLIMSKVVRVTQVLMKSTLFKASIL